MISIREMCKQLEGWRKALNSNVIRFVGEIPPEMLPIRVHVPDTLVDLSEATVILGPGYSNPTHVLRVASNYVNPAGNLVVGPIMAENPLVVRAPAGAWAEGDLPMLGEVVSLRMGVAKSDPAEPDREARFLCVGIEQDGIDWLLRLEWLDQSPAEVRVWDSFDELREALPVGLRFKVGAWGTPIQGGTLGRGLGAHHQLMRYAGASRVENVTILPPKKVLMRMDRTSPPPNVGFLAITDAQVLMPKPLRLEDWNGFGIRVDRGEIDMAGLSLLGDCPKPSTAFIAWGGRISADNVELTQTLNWQFLAFERRPLSLGFGTVSFFLAGGASRPLMFNPYGPCDSFQIESLSIQREVSGTRWLGANGARPRIGHLYAPDSPLAKKTFEPLVFEEDMPGDEP